MNKQQNLLNVKQMLDLIGTAAQSKDTVSLGAIMEVLGNRSFGPLLLLAGLITLAPLIGDIPGVPTIIGLFVFLMGVQLLLGFRHFWLPEWLLHRSVDKAKLHKALEWLKTPAGYIDRLLKPRLTLFVNGVSAYIIALLCIIIAMSMPALELIPFSANAAGAAFTIFGLSLIAKDGLLSLIAFILTALTVWLVTINVL